jgi:hypothetical protein
MGWWDRPPHGKISQFLAAPRMVRYVLLDIDLHSFRKIYNL